MEDSDTLRQIFFDSGVDLSRKILLIARGGISPAPSISFKLRKLGVTSEIVRDGMCSWCTAQGSSYPLISTNDLHYSEHKPIIVWALPKSRTDILEYCFKMHPEIQVYKSIIFPHSDSSMQNDQDARNSLRKAVYTSMLEILSANGGSTKVNVAMEQCRDYRDAEMEDSWLKSFNHIILVRDPEATSALQWYASLRGDEGVESINTFSYKNAFDILTRLKRIDAVSLILDTDLDLAQSPEMTMEHLCDFAGVEYKKSMFNWDFIQGDIQSAVYNEVDLARVSVEERNIDEEIYHEITATAAEVKPYYEAVVWLSLIHI